MTCKTLGCRVGAPPAAVARTAGGTAALQPWNCLDCCPVTCYASHGEKGSRVTMKGRLYAAWLICFTLLFFLTISISSATVLTFDDLSETGSGSFLANGYQGLNWSNFGIKNALLYAATLGSNGFYYGMVS